MMFQMPFINGNSNEPMTKSGWEDVLAAFLGSLIWGKVIRLSIKLKRPYEYTDNLHFCTVFHVGT